MSKIIAKVVKNLAQSLYKIVAMQAVEYWLL